VGASDYESDATLYAEGHDVPPAGQVPHRTNTELNLAVLRRYVPDIRSIVSIAANAVVYIFSPDAQTWDKSGVEGTLFVCDQEPAADAPGGRAWPRACVFVLNRKGLENVVINLAGVRDCEVASELLIFNMDDTAAPGREEAAAGQAVPKVIGLWVHADEDDTQAVNAAIIQEAWRSIRGAAPSDAAPVGVPQEAPVGQAVPAVGRRVSLTDLFGAPR